MADSSPPVSDPPPRRARSSTRIPRPPSFWVRRGRPFVCRLCFTLLMLVVAPIAVALIWLRIYGLPDGVKDRLLTELQNRGLEVSFEHLYLDPTGGIVAEDVTIYQMEDRDKRLVEVSRVRVGLAWLSWWEGRPLLETASVREADISLPVGLEEAVDLREVNADIRWSADGLNILSADARLLQFRLLLQGRLQLDGMKTSTTPLTQEEKQRRDELWRQLVQYSNELETPQPVVVQVEFDVPMSRPEIGHVRLAVMARDATWRGAPISAFTINAHLEDQVAVLDEYRLMLERGELVAHGRWRLADKTAELDVRSDMDFTPLAAALPERARTVLNRLSFRSLPEITGRVRLDWSDTFRYDVQTDIDWRDFIYGSTQFDRLLIAAAYDGRRILIPDGRLRSLAGDVDFEIFYDPDRPIMKARLDSNIDITVFQGMFGEGVDRFLASCRLPEGGPRIRAEAAGTEMKTAAWRIEGSIQAPAFVYKDVAFLGAESAFTFDDSTLTLNDLKLRRKEGHATGSIIYDFANRATELKELHTNLHVQEVAPVLGGKFPEYVAPYRFRKPPKLVVNGRVDLDDTKKKLNTDLTVKIDASSVMDWKLFGIDFAFDKPQGILTFVDRDLTVKMRKASLFNGTIDGWIKLNLESKNPRYETSLNLKRIDFRKLMMGCFSYEESRGTLDGDVAFSGRLGMMKSINGKGSMEIKDGYVTSIPFLGGLSVLLGNIIPNFGYALADRAVCDFTLAKGYVSTENLDMHSTNFTLIGEGRYNFVADDLDLNMRVNVRGLPGVFLFPVSKLFEYHGTGSLKKVEWRPVNF